MRKYLAIGAAISLLTWCVTAHAETLYVAPDGNDAWSGRLARPNADRTDGPLASLQGARDAIRHQKAAAAPGRTGAGADCRWPRMRSRSLSCSRRKIAVPSSIRSSIKPPPAHIPCSRAVARLPDSNRHKMATGQFAFPQVTRGGVVLRTVVGQRSPSDACPLAQQVLLLCGQRSGTRHRSGHGPACTTQQPGVSCSPRGSADAERPRRAVCCATSTCLPINRGKRLVYAWRASIPPRPRSTSPARRLGASTNGDRANATTSRIFDRRSMRRVSGFWTGTARCSIGRCPARR